MSDEIRKFLIKLLRRINRFDNAFKGKKLSINKRHYLKYRLKRP